MTRSYGSGGPEWQRKKEQPAFQESEPQPELREYDDDQPEWSNRLNKLSRYSDQEETVTGERVEFGRRLVATMIDMTAAYAGSAILAVVPFVNAFITQTLAMSIFMTVRDFFFEGRGIGKNLMGLQVVDARTGEPCSLMQSVKRNIIILGPILVLQVIMVALQIFNSLSNAATQIPQVATVVRWLNEAIPSLVNGLGGAYVLLVLPYEAYRVYSRKDGRRFGDQFAGTTVVESQMDFSNPVPRQ